MGKVASEHQHKKKKKKKKARKQSRTKDQAVRLSKQMIERTAFLYFDGEGAHL